MCDGEMSMHSTINRQQPWYASIRMAAAGLEGNAEAKPGWLDTVNRLCGDQQLVNHRGLPLKFVDQRALPPGAAYEAFISTTGQVPTRDNVHDFFNALAWLSFPCIKRQLNALQAEQIASAGVGTTRGPVRDAATLFDENGALLVISDAEPGTQLLDALREHRWQQVFIEQRQLFDTHAQVWLFGHALMEKLAKPYKGITAHAWPMVVSEHFFMRSHNEKRMYLDATVAAHLQQHELNASCFTPLPVLGVPGWWPNQDAAFYADADVFRPKRRAAITIAANS